MELLAYKEEDIARINAIYEEAFPEDERFPLEFLLENVGEVGRLEVLKEGQEVLGFIYLLIKDDLVHIFFLAIASTKRGKGLGSAILEAIKERHAGKRLFLALEPLDDKAINVGQRQRRYRFYTRLGFKPLDMQILERDISFAVMATSEVRAHEYDDMVLAWCGLAAKEYYHMTAI